MSALERSSQMKWFNLLLCVILIFSSFVFSGCASIICGSEKTVNISSSPVEAKFSITNRKGALIAQGVTPTNITLKRGSGYFKGGDYTITLEKQGYQTSVQPIKQGLETGWYAIGNIVFGGLIGWIIVDPITGAMYSIQDVNVSLLPEKTTMLMPQGNKLKILTTDQIPESMRHRMVRIN